MNKDVEFMFLFLVAIALIGGKIICEDIERIKDVKWLVCSCGREPFLNPAYEGAE